MESQTQTRERELTAEHCKIFDELASMRMLDGDLRTFGKVQPETWRQIYNEELTFVAEGINAPLRTSFTLRATPEGLVDERGRPLMDTLIRGRRAAELAATTDNRLGFNVRRAVLEYEEGCAVERMMLESDGPNTLFCATPFAREAHEAYGDDLLESIGMQPKRNLGFWRVYQKVSDHELRVISLSVDNSDLEIFTKVLATYGIQVPAGTTSDDFIGYRYAGKLDGLNQEILPDQLRYLYDQGMQQKHGGEFSAGRRTDSKVDAWQFIEAQRDLVEYYFMRLEQLAAENPHSIRAKRELTYSFWAALKERLDKAPDGSYIPRTIVSKQVHYALLEQEMRMSLSLAMARHEMMIGCGGMIGMEEDLLENDPENAMSSIMNSKEKSNKRENWRWKMGVCVVEKCSTRPGKTKVGPCSVCEQCQAKFDDGDDPTK